MSLPEFPTIDPPLTREDSINQIISSLAMQELALSHIINAEGEKLQFILGTLPGSTGPQPTIEQVLEVNESVRSVLESAAEVQSALRLKLHNALSAPTKQGPAGPAGPTGPAFGLNAFAGVYNNVARTTDLTANIPHVIDLQFTTSSRNASYDTTNSITVTEAGAYYISYSMLPIFSANATLTFAIRVNGINIGQTTNTIAGVPAPVWYAGDTIVDLPAGAIVDMVVVSSVDQTIEFDGESTETLNVLKLN